MAWELSSDRPIYVQLEERIQKLIVAGYYPPGGRLPSVRELAVEAAVNPNTMQRALAELESRGLVLTQRTVGRTVTDDAALIDSVRSSMAEGHLQTFLAGMKELGYTGGEVIQLLEKTYGGEEKNE